MTEKEVLNLTDYKVVLLIQLEIEKRFYQQIIKQ